MTNLWNIELDTTVELDTETLIYHEDYDMITFVDWVDPYEGIFLAYVEGYVFPQEVNVEDCEFEDR